MKGPLEKWEQALLYLYITGYKPIPPWAEEADNPQALVLARLMNWTEEDAVIALEEATAKGYADK